MIPAIAGDEAEVPPTTYAFVSSPVFGSGRLKR